MTTKNKKNKNRIITNSIGYIAAACTMIAFLIQFIKVWKTRSVKDLSLIMYVIYCSGLILWIVYGVMNKLLPLIVQTTFVFIFAFGILLFKIQEDIIKIR